MKRNRIIGLVLMLMAITVFAGCTDNGDMESKSLPIDRIYPPDWYGLDVGAKRYDAGVDVKLYDIDNDGDLDFFTVCPKSVVFYENIDGVFADGEKIFSPSVKRLDSGIGIDIGDIDDDGISEIIIAYPNNIEIFEFC